MALGVAVLAALALTERQRFEMGTVHAYDVLAPWVAVAAQRATAFVADGPDLYPALTVEEHRRFRAQAFGLRDDVGAVSSERSRRSTSSP